MNLKYRKEIDGLRAVAVLPAVLFHAGFEIFRGGFIGVDIFFVISGYLITTLILKPLQEKKFSLIGFYERRARRILPALFTVIFFTSILGFVFLTRSELGSYFESVTANLFFYSNLYFWQNMPYFASDAEIKPLIHTWSLAVEEQYYLFFPILLIFLSKFFKKFIIYFMFFGFLTSLLLAQLLATNTGGNLNFYFTLSRVWELVLGGISAYYLMNSKKFIFTKNLNQLLSLFGLILILLSYYYFSKEVIHPSFYTLAPTIGTVLIILFAKENTYANKLLSTNFLVGIGLISYSFYLWHQPLLAFGRIYFEIFTTQIKTTIIIISIFLSYFSWRFIEQPFRDMKKTSVRNLLNFTGTLFIILIIFSVLGSNFFSSNSTNSTEAKLAKQLSKLNSIYSINMDERQFIKNRIIHESLNPEIIVIGSSRTMEISNDLFDQNLLNLGVSGASIEDHITITEMALEKFNPKIILLGADPYLFNKYNYQLRWKSLSKEYQISLSKLRNLTNQNKIFNLEKINVEYAFYQKILEKIYVFINVRKLELELNTSVNKNLYKNIILRDGTILHKKGTQIEKKQDVSLNYAMRPYRYTEEYYKLYDEFIHNLVTKHKKKVILVLPPYRFNDLDLSVKEQLNYLDVEKKFKDLAIKNSIQIIGSYEQKNLNCTNEEFHDHMHPKKTCMNKIIKEIN